MFRSPAFVRLLTCFAIGLVLAACASTRNSEAVQVRARLNASTGLNPDTSGRPSPVVVRVLGLRTESEFNSAEFFSLWDREKETLSASLIASTEYVLQPGETRELRVALPRDTRYVGVVAAYRDIRGARWRAIQQAPIRTWTDTLARDRIWIDAGSTSISLVIAD